MSRLYLRWFFLQITIALLFGVILVGCSENHGNDYIRSKQAQDDAITALTNLGAKVEREQLGAMGAYSIDLSRKQLTNEVISHIAHLKPVGMLKLSEASVTDGQLANLIDHGIFGAVARLDLSHNQAITDQSLEKLAKIVVLMDLDLTGTKVTKEGIARLKQQLKELKSNTMFKGMDINVHF